jgi:hypothetical protein
MAGYTGFGSFHSDNIEVLLRQEAGADPPRLWTSCSGWFSWRGRGLPPQVLLRPLATALTMGHAT